MEQINLAFVNPESDSKKICEALYDTVSLFVGLRWFIGICMVGFSSIFHPSGPKSIFFSRDSQVY